MTAFQKFLFIELSCLVKLLHNKITVYVEKPYHNEETYAVCIRWHNQPSDKDLKRLAKADSLLFTQQVERFKYCMYYICKKDLIEKSNIIFQIN